jgi:hypothetical protein
VSGRRASAVKKASPRNRSRQAVRKRRSSFARRLPAGVFAVLLLTLAAGACVAAWVRTRYTFGLRSPVRIHFQWPLVVERRTPGEGDAEGDQQGRPLTPYQEYACRKFGSACRVALAIQRAENARGQCEIYHYNSDGTLDWGYFQINTVHLKRPGLNLRDLLDCKANIDFAYQLYLERGFTPWSTYNNGAYRQFLRER